MEYIQTDEQVAYIFTKVLCRHSFVKFRDKLGLLPNPFLVLLHYSLQFLLLFNISFMLKRLVEAVKALDFYENGVITDHR